MITPLREMASQATDPAADLVSADAEIERALLGALLIRNNTHEQVADIIRPVHFAFPIHGRIYAKIETLIGRGELADAATLRPMFDQDDALASIGSGAYLASLMASAVTFVNAPYYARQIRELAQRRELVAAGQDLIEEAQRSDIGRPINDILQSFDQKIINIQDGAMASAPTPIATAIQDALIAAERTYKNAGRITGVTTGLVDLDSHLGGLQPSDLIIVAGRPSMGKTALATGIAQAAAKADLPTLIFELEMSAEQLAARMMAEATGISAQDQRRGQLSADQINAVIAAGKDLSILPLTVDDTAGATIAQLRARALREKRQHGSLGLIVVDYLQLLIATKAEMRVQEVSAITRGLKMLAKELRVPVLALSQLSRAVEQRDNKRPMLSDLRESGSIEQDADIVLFVYREEYYLQHEAPVRRAEESDATYRNRFAQWQENFFKARGLAELIITKNRHGETGTVNVRFDAARTRFENLSQREMQ